MGLENYGTATELVMTKEQQQDVDAGLQKIRATMLRHGFSQEAVDTLAFKVSKHTLTISDEDRRTGAFHIHGDGQPFYAVSVSAPGSFMEGGLEGSPWALNARKQAQFLSFEVGMNLFQRVGDVLRDIYGHPGDDRITGGVSASMMFNFETTMRVEPKDYFKALNDLVEFRLNGLEADDAQKPKNAAKPNSAPKL